MEGVADGEHDRDLLRGLIAGAAIHDQLGRVVRFLSVQLAEELEPAGEAGLGGQAVEPLIGTAG